MEGITFLNSTAIMTLHPSGLSLIIFGLLILFLSFITAIFVLIINPYSSIGYIIIKSLSVIGIILSLGGLLFGGINPVEDYTQYDVLISEDINFQEFYEKYEIIEVKGQIYSIKERSSK